MNLLHRTHLNIIASCYFINWTNSFSIFGTWTPLSIFDIPRWKASSIESGQTAQMHTLPAACGSILVVNFYTSRVIIYKLKI